MFTRKRREQNEHDFNVAALGCIAAISKSIENVSGMKGRGAERMEAMALTVAAMGFDAESVKAVEIDWKVLRLNGDDELVPVIRLLSKDGETIQELEQKDKEIAS
jgi:hypothetical protein